MLRKTFTALFIVQFVTAPLAMAHTGQALRITCDNPQNLTAQYKTEVEQAILQQFPGIKVNCDSCYRSPQKQAAIRQSKGCAPYRYDPKCSGIAALPGTSDHQKMNIATCDLQGFRSSPVDLCLKLQRLCFSKFGGKCGIGVYGSTRAHFSAGGSGLRGWRYCRFLKGGPVGGGALEAAQGAQHSPDQQAAELSDRYNKSLLKIAMIVGASAVGTYFILNYMKKK